MLKVIKGYMVKGKHYTEKEDAELAARGQGEWGSDEYVHPVDLLVDTEQPGARTLGQTVDLYSAADPNARERALRKLTDFDKKVLGLIKK